MNGIDDRTGAGKTGAGETGGNDADPERIDEAAADIRAEILRQAVQHVPFDGWTKAALHAGARDLGLGPEDADFAFPGGVVEAVLLHARLADAEMIEAVAAVDMSQMKIRDRVAAVIRARLEPRAHEREAIRIGLSLLSLPQNAPAALRSLYHTVDDIWWAAGDRSTDFSFYTKRTLLAGVYSSTLLYWLEDRSEGQADSWAFLDRRIADVMRLPKIGQRVGKVARCLPDPRRLFRRPGRRGRPAWRPAGLRT